MPAFLRKYNTLLVTGTTAIRIPIIKRGVVDYAVGADWTPAAGDVKIMTDAAAAANVTNLPIAIAAGNGAYWEFILTAAELSGKQALVTVVDAATKAIEDQAFIIETYGNAAAMYAADLSLANLPAVVNDVATSAAQKIADFTLRRQLANVEASGAAGLDAENFRSLYGAIAKLVNLISTIETAGKLTMYKSDDATVLGRQTLTTDAAALPITVANTD